MSDAKDLEPGFARIVRLLSDRRLPGITRGSRDGAPALLVADRALATMLEPNTVILACPSDQKVLLMDISPDLYFETEPFVGKNDVLVRLDRIKDDELSLRLHDAWEYLAPDKLRQYVD
ncbi:MmcQ/YjbR family DNA-binding protein [Devosia sp. CAU 1758]